MCDKTSNLALVGVLQHADKQTQIMPLLGVFTSKPSDWDCILSWNIPHLNMQSK